MVIKLVIWIGSIRSGPINSVRLRGPIRFESAQWAIGSGLCCLGWPARWTGPVMKSDQAHRLPNPIIKKNITKGCFWGPGPIGPLASQ